MSARRVAFVTPQYARVNSGPGTFAQYVRDNLDLVSADISFFSEQILEPSEDDSEHPVVVPRYARITVGQLLRYRAYHRAWLRAHQREPFDVVWYNDTPALGVFSVLSNHRPPVVLTISDYSNIESRVPLATRDTFGTRRSIVRSVLHRIEKHALRRCDLVVTNSSYMKSRVARAYRIPEHRIRVLRKGVDLHRFRRSEHPHAMSDPVRILFLKSDYVRGGLEDLLKALAGFPGRQRFHLTIAGPSRRHYRKIGRMVSDAGYHGELELAGRVARDDVVGLIHASDIVCVPSRSEALGVVYLEALASGVVAVGTNVGGIPEVLDNGRAGWMTSAGVPASLAAVLSEVLENPEECARRRAHGLEHVRQFSTREMIRNFGDILAELPLGPSR